ncbi:hypothetical protein SEA_SATIS_283 [Streptomyces phage Satis]|nr:hypothetical protein SEA_SATIS_283 [Streptomyces phage Satis]
MAKEITVHRGTSTNGAGVQRPAAWVVTQIVLEPEAHDLVNALGSKYLRYETTEDDETVGTRPRDLPESLTQREILKIYREEILHYGDEVMGMWADEAGTARRAACEEWLKAIVLDAFPAMKGYEL